MSAVASRIAAVLLALTTAIAAAAQEERRAPGPLLRIPDKLVVLTFDDAKASHYTVVRPILKHDQGFKAIAVRDLAQYVDWRQKPADPWKIIDERRSELARPNKF
jgi:hypothetical protein